jgi:hypothetical protein
MAKEDKADLLRFLEPFPRHVQETALLLRDLVWDLYPESNELIYDNYSALAFGWGLSDRLGDVFCSVACYNNTVNLGFNRGRELRDPKKILLGNGNIYRYIKAGNRKDFPAKYVQQLLHEAYVNALARYKTGKNTCKGKTIVKSVSAKKRRPLQP